MALPSSGAISLDDVRKELGITGAISLGNDLVRTLAGVSSGPISLSDIHGKSSVKNIVLTVTISASVNNYDVLAAFRAAGWNGSSTVDATIIVNSGVIVGSNSTSVAALNISGFSGTCAIINNGVICGAGGTGGTGADLGAKTQASPPTPGGAGGAAINLGLPVTITNNGSIFGGGGGGGGSNCVEHDGSDTSEVDAGSGGSGGQGQVGGAAGIAGKSTSNTSYYYHGTAGKAGSYNAAGAASGKGGKGGAWGAAGANSTTTYYGYGSVGAGGAGGAAVITNGNAITWGGTRGKNATYVKGTY